jgi:hypothetical protein
VEVGDTCAATSLLGSSSLVSLGHGTTNPTLPALVPMSGVITRWSLRTVVGISPPHPQVLKVYRPTALPGKFAVVAESDPIVLASGLNTAAARIPVQTGDHLGLSEQKGAVQPFSPLCLGSGEGIIGVVSGDPTVGSTVEVSERPPGSQLPIVATIEPDADGDGFGDETQDLCPQSAASQAACFSPIGLSLFRVLGKSSVTVLAGVDSQAPVTVSGSVRVGKGRTVELQSPTQTLATGKIVAFTLRFPARLMSALRALPRKRSLKLSLTASATNAAGQVSTSELSSKLRGRAEGRRR